jgi:hypothetical protein
VALGWGVETIRDSSFKSTMRTNAVVLLTEIVEERLFGAQRIGWAICCRLLERTVDAFMAPILLRPAWNDAVEANAELDPPDGKPTESPHGKRGERRTVVSENRGGKAVLVEATLECPPDGISARIR